METKLSSKILPMYRDLHKLVMDSCYNTFVLKGGRGSGKSYYISEGGIVLRMVWNHIIGEDGDVVVIRNVMKTHAKSTYQQIKVAVHALGLEKYFVFLKNPLEIRYYPKGIPKKQTQAEKDKYVSAIHFLGCDDEEKIKSFNSGRPVTTVWVEEVTELDSIQEQLEGSILQSLFRGTNKRTVLFLSYNPNIDDDNHVNKWVREIASHREDTYILHTTYLQVPESILGQRFVRIAKQMEKERPKAYRHIYLGESSGITKRIWTNIFQVKYTQEMLMQLTNTKEILIGADWGSTDPSASIAVYYDKENSDIYVLHEYEKRQASIDNLYSDLERMYGGRHIWGDNNPPIYIQELQKRGLNIDPVKKNTGNLFTMNECEWVELNVNHIYVDPDVTPRAFECFTNYVRDVDKKTGKILNKEAPGSDNHLCDALRYALHEHIHI